MSLLSQRRHQKYSVTRNFNNWAKLVRERFTCFAKNANQKVLESFAC